MDITASPFGVEVKEVARLLGVSVSHVYRIAQRDPTFPPSRRIGRSARYDPGEVRVWFDAQVEPRTARAGRRSQR